MPLLVCPLTIKTLGAVYMKGVFPFDIYHGIVLLDRGRIRILKRKRVRHSITTPFLWYYQTHIILNTSN